MSELSDELTAAAEKLRAEHPKHPLLTELSVFERQVRSKTAGDYRALTERIWEAVESGMAVADGVAPEPEAEPAAVSQAGYAATDPKPGDREVMPAASAPVTAALADFYEDGGITPPDNAGFNHAGVGDTGPDMSPDPALPAQAGNEPDNERDTPEAKTLREVHFGPEILRGEHTNGPDDTGHTPRPTASPPAGDPPADHTPMTDVPEGKPKPEAQQVPVLGPTTQEDADTAPVGPAKPTGAHATQAPGGPKRRRS